MNPTAELLQPEVLELIQQGRFEELREALHLVPPADVADILAALDPKQAAVGFRFLQRDDAGEVFSYLEPEKQEQLIKELGAEASVGIIEAMSADDRARLIDELPGGVAQRIVASLSPKTRGITQAILGYKPGTVGRLMTPDYVAVRPHWTIAEALDHIRKHGRDAETVNVIYVVDNDGRLIDDMRLRQLLFADPAQSVESIMTRSFYSLRADEPQETAVAAMNRYDRIALPVVDTRGVLVGIVTADDVADIAQAEATEDIQKLGGVGALQQPYIETGHLEMFRKRGVWLSALFVGQTVTIIVLGAFQNHIERAVELALFMPLVISCGGNSGSQAATLVTRAIALGEVTGKDWLRIIGREAVTASLLAGTLGLMGLLCVEFFTNLIGHPTTAHPMMLGVTIGASIVGVVLWGTMLGSLLPLALRRLSIDPATASSPMVATLMDASGTLIYLGVAILVLTGTIL
ncbi:MAG: magnesium transporter [Phycisphaerales bacterium]